MHWVGRKGWVYVLLVCICSLACAAPQPRLEPRYAHWLTEEVPYLINDDERDVFTHLKTDADRDKFIETFWQARNPDPNAPTNEVRDENYQRIAYANAHFGYGNVQDGWRSDRGMVYITLGPPKQIDRYPETRELKPLQIWFYQNTSGALPVHFYVVFYKQSQAEDYELYSPYGDRPQKLINSTNAVNNDRVAIKLIQENLDDQAAHIALSLIPGEPVDLKEPYPSLQSDVMLNNIRNYRNLPQIRDAISLRRSNLEAVSHRVILGEQFSDLTAVAMRDPERQASIHYLFRLLHPNDLSVSEQPDGRRFYSLDVETKVTSADGRVVSQGDQALSEYLSADAFSHLAGKCLGVEGRIPVAPGRYELSLVLNNKVSKQAFRQTRTVVVPGVESRIGISQVFFASPDPPRRSVAAGEPFSFAGARLQPIGSDRVVIEQGEPLRTIFQLWMAPGTPAALQGKQVNLHYLIGKLSAPERMEEDQAVDRSGFTPEGNLLMGKDFRTDSLAPGLYHLVIKASDPESGATAFQTLTFEVQDRSRPVAQLWTLDVEQPGSEQARE